jgi:hypothetical protein
MNPTMASLGNCMRRLISRSLGAIRLAPIVLVAAGLAGCASQTGYESAFSAKTTLAGNSHSFKASPDQTFKTVKITLVQQGFTIETADNANGLIKAVRAFEDPKAKKVSYLVTTSMDVTGSPSGDATIVTASASQQTVLHKDSEKYYHLLGLVPIPTGKDYQTIVRKEGNITDAAFYNDLFAAILKNLPAVPVAAAVAYPLPVPEVAPPPVAAPAPAAPVAPAAPPTPAAGSQSTSPPVSTSGDAKPPEVPAVRDMANPFDTAQQNSAPASAN